MQGQILQLNDAERTGLILGSDGKRYPFTSADWRGGNPPSLGGNVDFVAAEDAAREIFPINSGAFASAMSSASSVAPTDNSIVLGWLGVGSLVLSFMIPVLPLIAAFVLGLLGASSAKRTGSSTGLMLSRVAWIGSLVLVLAGVILVALGLSFLGLVAGISFHEFMKGNWSSVHQTMVMVWG